MMNKLNLGFYSHINFFEASMCHLRSCQQRDRNLSDFINFPKMNKSLMGLERDKYMMTEEVDA